MPNFQIYFLCQQQSWQRSLLGRQASCSHFLAHILGVIMPRFLSIVKVMGHSLTKLSVGSVILGDNCNILHELFPIWAQTLLMSVPDWITFEGHRSKVKVTVSQKLSIGSVFSCELAAQWMVFSVCLSVLSSVCPSHLFDYVPIIVSPCRFQDLWPWSRVTSVQKIKVKVIGQIQFFGFRTITLVWINWWQLNFTQAF